MKKKSHNPQSPPDLCSEGSPLPSYSYFDHDADIGIHAWGTTLEEAFIHCAEATFSLMGDFGGVTPRIRIDLRFEEKDLELALYQWINLLLSEATIGRLLLCKFSLVRQNDLWQGSGWGERWRDELIKGIEVKGATMTSISVRHPLEGRWETRLIVDV